MNPYQTLGLDAAADDQAIRQRYLELVRQFPPDREPDRFREIREAYEALKDPLHQLNRQLFGLRDAEPLAALVAELREPLRDKRIPLSVLSSLVEFV